MYKILIVILIYLAIGASGMVLANKKADAATASARWLKYRTYVLIVALVFASIFFKVFWIAATIIIVAGIFELRKGGAGAWTFVLYLILSIGFFWFAFFFSPQLQLFIYFQVMAFDAFSQIVGQLIGKTVIGGKISPSKTLEGLAGGLFFCLLSAFLAGIWLELTIGFSLVCGLLTAVFSFSGDMLASWNKRRLGIKDYSKLLPGQGGFLDRFDSLIFTGCMYMLLSILLSGIFPNDFTYGNFL